MAKTKKDVLKKGKPTARQKLKKTIKKADKVMKNSDLTSRALWKLYKAGEVVIDFLDTPKKSQAEKKKAKEKARKAKNKANNNGTKTNITGTAKAIVKKVKKNITSGGITPVGKSKVLYDKKKGIDKIGYDKAQKAKKAKAKAKKAKSKKTK